MSKLWIFGDSYSIPLDYLDSTDAIKACVDGTIYTTNWIEEVAKGLPVTDLKVFSNFGISNEWIFKNAMEQSNNFSPDDYVIIQLTNSNRHWFFPDDPTSSNIAQSVSDSNHSKEKRKAIEGYLKYLQNDQMDYLIYSSIIYSFMYVKLALPGIKMLFLPGWGTAPGSIGNLTNNVCDAEFDCFNTQELFYSKTGYDPRLNHMTINNHYVLANKVVESFTNQTPIDLTTGFEANIYTKDNV